MSFCAVAATAPHLSPDSGNGQRSRDALHLEFRTVPLLDDRWQPRNMTSPYVAVIRHDVTPGWCEHEPPLNAWWREERLMKLADLNAFDRAWSLRVVRHDSERGDPGPRYLAVYDVHSIDGCGAALAEERLTLGPSHHHSHEWLNRWSVTYFRRVTSYKERDMSRGRYWAIVKSDLQFGDERDATRFGQWYDSKHIPEICAARGVHGAWRWEVETHESGIGTADHRFWAVYSVESPADFAAARAARTSRGVPPFDGIWTDNVRDWALSFQEILRSYPSGTCTQRRAESGLMTAEED